MKGETTARAFLYIARNYCEAANILFDDNSTRRKNQLQLDPIYMLYFHATEVALKAFLRHKGFKTKDLKKIGHSLTILRSKCIEMGLVSSNSFAQDLRSITSLLDSGNDEWAFRYWNPKSLNTASIDWVKKVVNKLIELMETYIPMNKKPGNAVKVILVVSEPQPQKSKV